MQNIRHPLISIIVPIHNAGRHLDKCLTSLINQELENIEIILVIDCPTDGSDIVAENFAEKDNRIKLIFNSENLHTGLSRNEGINIAQGEYIGFMDHDDFCDLKMYKILYELASHNDADITRCNFFCDYIKNDADHTVEKYNYPPETQQIQDKSWIYEYVCGNKVSCVIWNHIYKAEFIRSNKLFFLDSRNICSEDSIFFMQAYSLANSFYTVPDFLYHHIFHTSNTGKNYNYRSIKNRINFFNELYSYLRLFNVDENVCYGFLAENLSKSLYSAARQSIIDLPIRQSLKEIRTIYDSKLVIGIFNYLTQKSNKSIFSKQKITVKLFVYIMKIVSVKSSRF